METFFNFSKTASSIAHGSYLQGMETDHKALIAHLKIKHGSYLQGMETTIDYQMMILLIYLARILPTRNGNEDFIDKSWVFHTRHGSYLQGMET